MKLIVKKKFIQKLSLLANMLFNNEVPQTAFPLMSI